MEPLDFLKSPDFQLLIGTDTLTINAPSQLAALELADVEGERLAHAIAALNFRACKIVWKGAIRPLKILASMADDDSEVKPNSPLVQPTIFGHPGFGFDAADLKLLERLCNSSKPMSLVGMIGVNEDMQRWVNQGLVNMLQRPYNLAIQLDVKQFWQETNLNELKDLLTQQNSVDLNEYRATLPYAAAIFSSTFELVEFSLIPNEPKLPMRLVTIHNYEPITNSLTAWV
ncbi:MAG: hypothetical protein KME64_41545 [Scytonematopsis contorta HA4267-MV1]|jgi:hypothetical protein|nr:hypothetical protein [Scytonematopsis contorta HA4267-MV1]